MAYARVKVEDSFYNTANMWVPGASQFICETEDDVEALPVDVNKIAIGSRAMVISTGHIYIFGPSKKWLQYKGIAMME